MENNHNTYQNHEPRLLSLLQKLGHQTPTAMQREVFTDVFEGRAVWLTSPTGSGKTLAYLLPVLLRLESTPQRLLVIVPTRELAIQTTQVVRNLGMGFSVCLCYGGNDRRKEISALTSEPKIIIGTPGRLCDHLRHDRLSGNFQTLVLDEYDKSLEIGFAEEMKLLLDACAAGAQIVLTSATKDTRLPLLDELIQWKEFDYSSIEKSGKIKTWIVTSPEKDKLNILGHLLNDLSDQKTIVFVNYKEAAERIGNWLADHHIAAGVFHGGLDQKEREWMIARFRNGIIQILVSTDLSARGLDIPQARYVIHYQMPHRREEMVHRNGRTGRMGNDGDIYFIRYEGEDLPSFLEPIPTEYYPSYEPPVEKQRMWDTWIFNRGKKDKLSKGDIVGFLIQTFGLTAEDIGPIDMGEYQAVVAVSTGASGKMAEGFYKIKKLSTKLMNK